jgi:hypothetical protein
VLKTILIKIVSLLTPIKTAIDRPLVTGSLWISAYIPPTTAIGLLAFMPVTNLKINRAGKFGATAQAMVKIVKPPNVESIITFRPYVSESGPNSSGPRT